MNILPTEIWSQISAMSVGKFPLISKQFRDIYYSNLKRLKGGSYPLPYQMYFADKIYFASKDDQYLLMHMEPNFQAWNILTLAFQKHTDITDPLVVTLARDEYDYDINMSNCKVVTVQKLLKDISILDSYKLVVFVDIIASKYNKQLIPLYSQLKGKVWFVHENQGLYKFDKAVKSLQSQLHPCELHIKPSKKYYEVVLVYVKYSGNLQGYDIHEQVGEQLSAYWLQMEESKDTAYLYDKSENKLKTNLNNVSKIHLGVTYCERTIKPLQYVKDNVNKYPLKPTTIHVYAIKEDKPSATLRKILKEAHHVEELVLPS